MTQDTELVAAAVAGDRDAFERLYRRYFDRTYDFAVRTTKDPHRAADVVQDAWIKVHERLHQLRDPEAFRSWLFSIVRREALAGFRTERRSVPMPTLGSDDVPNELQTMTDRDPLADPVTSSELDDSAQLVWEAAAALDARTYTVLDLHVRQGLSSAEIADVLGVKPGAAYTMLSRMKDRVAGAIAAYLLVRKGSADCVELSRMVAGATIPPFDRRLRRRVDRHARSCDTCERTRRRLVAPMSVFAAMAAVPAPSGLADQVWARIPEATPVPPVGGSRTRWRRTAMAVVAGAALLVGGTVMLAGGAWSGPSSPSATLEPASAVGASSSTEAPPSTAGGSLVPGAPAITTTTSTTPPTSTTTSTTPPTSTTTTVAPDTIAPTIRRLAVSPAEIWELDDADRSCPSALPRQADIIVDAVDDVAIDRVTASWNVGASSTTIVLTSSGSTYTGVVGPFAAGTVGPRQSPMAIEIIVVAVDTSGNESKDTTTLFLHSIQECS